MKTMMITIICVCIVWVCSSVHAQDAYLGVHYNHISSEKAAFHDLDTEDGIWVVNVVDGSGAAEADIRAFDFITSVNGRRVETGHELEDAIDEAGVGNTIPVELTRTPSGESLVKFVTIGSSSDARPNKISKMNEAFLGISSNHMDLPRNVEGVPVNVVKESSAEEAGLQNGDIIIAMDGVRPYDWHDVGAFMDNKMPGEQIEVNVYRDGAQLTKTAILKSEYATKGGKVHMDMEGIVVEIEPLDPKAIEGFTPVTLEELVTQTGEKTTARPVLVTEPVSNSNSSTDIDLSPDQINLFPNPSNGMFNLTVNFANAVDATIQIFDSSGRRVYQRMVLMPTGQFQDYVDISESGVGQFILLIQQGNNRMTKKIIVTRS